MKIYKGVRYDGNRLLVTVQQGKGKAKQLKPRQDLPKHPQAFEWGSAPDEARVIEHRKKCTQLAYAILEDVLGKDRAKKDCSLYAVNVIANLHSTLWTLTKEHVVAATLQMSLQQQEWKDRRRG